MRSVGLALALATAAAGPVAAGCRLALVFGLDVSASVNEQEYRLQTRGLAAALTAPAVQQQLFAAGLPPVRIAVFAWSGPAAHHPVLPWTEISDPDALDRAARRIAGTARVTPGGDTAIGSAMLVARDLLAEQPECRRHVADLSGDGPSNAGPAPAPLKARLPDRMVLNALSVGRMEPIGSDGLPASTGVLADYYRQHVIRGRGAFVEVARNYADFARAMEAKVLRELPAIVLGQAPRDRASPRHEDVPARLPYRGPLGHL